MPQDVPETPDGREPSPEALQLEILRAERDHLADAVKAAVSETLAQIPESRRALVPESLSPAERLVYLMRNRSLLIEPEPAAQPTRTAEPTFASEKALATRTFERPWTDLTCTEKVRLAKERPDQFRRLREAHLTCTVVATR